MDTLASVLLAGAILVGSFLWLLSFISPTVFSSNPRAPFPSELSHISIDSQSPQPLPSILDTDNLDDDIHLSVVIPAYNEATRLPVMLDEALDFLESMYKSRYEVLIVDDGSKDKTATVALDLARKRKASGGSSIRVVVLKQNRGKGGAVRHGMLHARGKRILFVDADGASKFEDLALLSKEMDVLVGANQASTANGKSNGHNLPEEPRAIVLGSRAHMVSTEAVVKRSKLRNLLMRSFHIYLSVLGIRHIADTQCGFKLFTRSAARAIFPSLHVEGWIFDIEILIIALMLGDVQTKEVSIRWNEVEGSKMDLVKDSIRMATDLLVIRASYAIGRWKVKRQ